jgi:hypothetical protein
MAESIQKIGFSVISKVSYEIRDHHSVETISLT